jgi:adenine-specific DNA-methyltransferase
MEENAADAQDRRFILVQLPEPIDQPPLNDLADLAQERLRRAAAKIKSESPAFEGDLGFRVFKLASSNIRGWQPDRTGIEESLFDSVEHLDLNRTEEDILYELLLKLGLDLCVPMEERTIAGKAVTSIGAGVLVTCLAEQISRHEVELLAQGIVSWHKTLAPVGDTMCIFRDSAFEDDVVKVNLVAILNQNGIHNVRSL